MNKELTTSKVEQMLAWAYEQSVSSHGPIDGAIELAASYQGRGSPREDADALIRWQVRKAMTSGFVTGIGGLLTMPVTFPVNLASVWFIQIRMIAAIAHLGGYDLKDDRVKTLCLVCLCGNSATAILRDAGMAIGTKMTESALKQLLGRVFIEINKKVGFRLITKFGEKGVINVSKMIPILAGLIGAGVDGLLTRAVGKQARKTFTPD